MSPYKYVHEDRVDVLETGLIRFSQPGAFNDPFELLLSLPSVVSERAAEEQFEAEFETRVKDQYAKLPASRRASLPYETVWQEFNESRDELLKGVKAKSVWYAPEVARLLKERFDEAVGILSLAEKPNNLLMWAHYSNSHQGFVIEFDERHSFFNQRRGPGDELRHLQKVRYRAERPNLTLDDLNGVDVLLTKSKDWEYEQEWRMFVALADCTKRVGSVPFDICLLSMPSECMRGVVLGCRVTADTERRLKDVVLGDARYSHMMLRRAVPDPLTFKLNVVD